MNATTHPAEVLADSLDLEHLEHAEMLRRIPALEADLEAARAQRDKFMEREDAQGKRAEAAEAERDAAQAEVLEQARLLGMSGERELALRAEIERLRKDAERYRWLRSDNQKVAGPCAYAPWMGPPMFNEELDSAIDAARKQQ